MQQETAVGSLCPFYSLI